VGTCYVSGRLVGHGARRADGRLGRRDRGRARMISNLQLLRALAALGVVFYHTAFTFNGGVHTEFQGVAVFFVISGFIMTHITRDDSGHFFTQRLIRIVPLYWLCTLPFLAMWFKGTGRAWADASIAHIVESLFFIPYRDVNGDTLPLLGVGWTLNLEMFFYAVFALSLAVSRRWAPALTCAALIAAKIIPSRLDCSALPCEFYAHDYTSFLMAGILSFYAWKALAPHMLGRGSIVALLTAVMVAVFLALNVHPPFAAAALRWSPFPLGYLMPPLLVISLLLLHSAQLRWKWRLALLLGDASYALYLTHTIVIEAYRVGRDRLVGDQIAVLNPADSLIAAAALMAVCSAIAVVVHLRIELPIVRWLRRKLVVRATPRPDPDAASPSCAASRRPP
jgi:exopolysaccharide production protein ExoZ